MKEETKQSIYEKLSRMTGRVESKMNDGSIANGTGFYFSFIVDEKTYIPTFVTNAHLVEDAKEISFQFRHSYPNNREEMRIGQLTTSENEWIYHPNEDIDLCLIPFAPVLKNKESKSIITHVYTAFRSDQLLQSFECDILENVLMIGYPNGLWDNVNLFPIIRKGITATPPLSNYKGNKEFLVDIAAHEGSSGSPVFIPYDYMSKKLYDSCDPYGVLLAGILWGGETTEARRYCADSGSEKEGDIIRIPNNLGQVIHADVLLDFESILKKRKIDKDKVSPNN